jgi:adenylate cyclase
VDIPKNNVLAEFASVVDAMQCAVEIQEVLTAKNAGLFENRGMEFRIRTNLGEVIVESGRTYGAGNHIAGVPIGLKL